MQQMEPVDLVSTMNTREKIPRDIAVGADHTIIRMIHVETGDEEAAAAAEEVVSLQQRVVYIKVWQMIVMNYR